MERKKFIELDEKIRIGRCTIPHAVFTTLNPDDETTEQVMDRQEKFLKLPEDIKNKLASLEVANKIKAIGEHYNLELLQMAPIARVIRNYYFGEVKKEDFAEIISRESKISLVDAQNIARYLIERIISRDAQTKTVAQIEKLKIMQALEKYPEIKDQLLTNNLIELAGQTVRPTIANWIRDYHDTVGAGNRDIMKRSSYLYHGKNTKSLSVIDRQKVSNILKSIDEGFLLKVDVSKKEIIFNLVTPGQGQVQPQTKPVDFVKEIKENVPVVEKKDVVLEKTIFEKPKSDFKPKFEDKSENKETLIRHVHGNSWDLKSAHFLKKDNEKQLAPEKQNFLLGTKKRDDFEKSIDKKEENNIKFSSPQQLPVEKEKSKEGDGSKNKGVFGGKFKNFFGRIEPLE